MATLLSSSVNGSLVATNSISSPKLLQTNSTQSFKEYIGTVSIPSSYNNPTNYADIFGNHGGYERMMGYVSWTVYQSQIHTGSFVFQLSRYGLSTFNLQNSGYWSVSMYAQTADQNYIRFTNTVGTEWGNGTFYFVARITGLGGHSFQSSYLTERVR